MTCDYKKPQRQGWRTFHCSCGIMWAQTTRDYLSPSLDNCPKCNEDCFPIDSWQDTSIEVDKCSNLTKHQSTYK